MSRFVVKYNKDGREEAVDDCKWEGPKENQWLRVIVPYSHERKIINSDSIESIRPEQRGEPGQRLEEGE